MNRYNPSSAHPARAQQAWQILVGAAMNRRTFTYKGLSVVMYGKEAQGVLAQVLDHIARYCNENGLPVLTAIVVAQGRGTPGLGMPADHANLDHLREDVYGIDWYDIVPPTPEELKAARAGTP